MDPSNGEWPTRKSDQPTEHPYPGNLLASLLRREQDLNPRRGSSNRTVLENVAEDRLVHKVSLNIRSCDLPGYPRSTFLMVFSPDGTRVASTHGNHKIYVTELATGKHVRVLKGHPRTPWCIAFHPSHDQLIGSGCLGGQVRVWDLSGGSETWTVGNETVIASIAFHPRDQLLVIATYNELYFWDWSQPAPITKVCTNNVNEKVRFVAFDSLGHKLITGIAFWPPQAATSSLLQTAPPGGPSNGSSSNGGPPGSDSPPPSPPNNPPASRQDGSAQDMIFTSYHNLVQRYDNLMRNYHRLMLARTPGGNTTDRGTDPMEVEWLYPTMANRARVAALRSNTRSPIVNANPLLGRLVGDNRDDRVADREREPLSADRLFLDVLSLDGNTPSTSNQSEASSTRITPQDDLIPTPIFGSRLSAFQPLNDYNIFPDASPPPSFDLPNPFSPTFNAASQADLRNRIRDSSSRIRVFLERRNRSLERIQEMQWQQGRLDNIRRLLRVDNNNRNPQDRTESGRPVTRRPTARILRPRTSRDYYDNILSRDPLLSSANVAPRTSNPSATESQGPSLEPSNLPTFHDLPPTHPRGPSPPRDPVSQLFIDHGDDLELDLPGQPEGTSSPPFRGFSNPLNNPDLRNSDSRTSDSPQSVSERSQESFQSITSDITQNLDYIRDILRDSGSRLLNLITYMSTRTDSLNNSESASPSSNDRRISSDSDSDHSLEVNIYRTRNATIPDNTETTTENNQETERTARPTNRMVVNLDLGEGEGTGERTLNNNRINITVSNNRFRVRTNLENRDNLARTQSHEHHPLEHSTSVQNPTAIIENSSTSIENSSAATDNLITATENPTASTYNPIAAAEYSSAATENATTSSIDPSDITGPSTSSGATEARAESTVSRAESLRKVRLAVEALQRHTATLTNMWLSGTQTSMRELRILWENLRRHLVALQRQSSRQETPSYFIQSIYERCQMLRDNARRARNHPSSSVSTDTAVQADVRPSTSREMPSTSVLGQHSNYRETRPSTSGADTPSTSRHNHSNSSRVDRSRSSRNRSSIESQTQEEPSTSAESESARTRINQRRTRVPFGKHFWKLRFNPSTRRRLQSRGRADDDVRRRHRIFVTNIINRCINSSRSLGRSRRRDSIRTLELNFTRREIQLRSMQVLSVLFTLMMSCLEERELSTHIIAILRSLKKSFGVTCLLAYMSARRDLRRSRNANVNNESHNNNTTLNSEVEANETANTSNENASNNNTESNSDIQINDTIIPENENTTDENMEENSDANEQRDNIAIPVIENNHSVDVPTTIEDELTTNISNIITGSEEVILSPIAGTSQEPNRENTTLSEPEHSTRWSDRVAVQISAVNKNQTDMAKRRRALYLERKRQKILHRVNPAAYPLNKKKNLPPTSHRIPSRRLMPPRNRTLPLQSSVDPLLGSPMNDPVPGPSTSQPSYFSTRRNTPPDYNGLIRLAEFQAARIRSETRHRYRIRLYASVREILQSTNREESEPEEPAMNNAEDTNRRPFSTYRPRLRLTSYLDNLNEVLEEEARNRPLDSVLNNVAVPLFHVNDLPINDAQGSGDAPPRVHEYLQPIILAQNALVAEEGGGAGLIDAGLIPEALVGMASPAHRVQAWDFTRGKVPDIRDSTKNVVVPRCKIHNDASIDISRDGRLLVALLPVHRMRNMSHRLGVYSLEWATLGQCLHTAVLDQNVVSVALSPTARHLAVGLGSRRVTTLPHNRNNVFAVIFRLSQEGPVDEKSRHCGLIPVRILDQQWEHSFTSLNCLRWAPTPGQGLVLANNTGQLVVMS